MSKRSVGRSSQYCSTSTVSAINESNRKCCFVKLIKLSLIKDFVFKFFQHHKTINGSKRKRKDFRFLPFQIHNYCWWWQNWNQSKGSSLEYHLLRDSIKSCKRQRKNHFFFSLIHIFFYIHTTTTAFSVI